MRPQVLYVSKPVVAPFNDGSKCLVRDIAGAMTAVVPRVMVTQGGESGLPGVAAARIYRKSTGRYRPALVDNARVFLWLLTRSRESLWHFVFAPNPRTCQMGRLLKGIRGIPVVQTVASPPRTFQDPHRLLFGDVVVTQSHWTKDEFLRAYRERGTREPPRIEVIPPAVPHIERPTPQRISVVRGQLEIPENAPLLLYPGDLEVSRASHWVAGIVEPLLRAAPEVRVVFAYREKTPRAAECAKALQAKLPLASVRFVSEVPDMHALLATTQVVLFPVDDLYGKVDLPIVILEAMHLGVPVVALDRGPLADLEGVLRVAPGDEGAILDKALRVLRDDSFRQACVEAQRDAIERQHRPAQVARRYEAIYQNLLTRLPD